MFSKICHKYDKLKRYIKWMYMLYELNTYIAICEPWEKVFLNTLAVVFLGGLLYSTLVFIPGYLLVLVKYVTPANFLNETHASMNEVYPDR